MTDVIETVKVETATALLAAAQALAANDADYATEENGVGYNGTDTHFGHGLAVTPLVDWDAEVCRAAYVMLRKYKVQLRSYGLDFEAIEEPRVVVDDATAKFYARGVTYAHRSAARRKANPPTLTKEGATYVLRFPRYDPEWVAAVKTLPFGTRTFDGQRKVWIVKPEAAGPLAKLVDDLGALIEDSDLASTLAEASEAQAEVAALPAKRVELHGDLARIIFPYDGTLVSKVRVISGARFRNLEDTGEKFWEAPVAEAGLALLAFAEQHGFHVADGLAEVLAEAEKVIAGRVAASGALDSDLEIEGVREGLALAPFQRAGVEYALHAKRVLIGDEMGLGKTVQALATVVKAGAFPAVIVVPAVVKLNWLREIDKWFPGRSMTLLTTDGEQKAAFFREDSAVGTSKVRFTLNDLSADFIVLNYDILEKCLPRLTTGVAGRRAVIFDEVHYLKNYKAKRTKAAAGLAKGVEYVIGLTGTAILNRASELISPLTILGRIGVFGGVRGFLRRYCDGDSRSMGNPETLPELHQTLRQHCYVRRNKKDVLTELPAVRRSSDFLPITNRKAYDAAADDIRKWARARVYADAKFMATLEGLDEDERALAIGERLRHVTTQVDRAEMLVKMTALRQLAGLGKIEAAKRWVADLLDETEGKLILFAWHREVQQALVEAVPAAARIFGDDSPQVRQAQADRFQTDPDCRLIVVSINAGGVGITLTAAENVAFLELPWRPGDIDQAEGRAYGRLNDAHGINSYYLLAEDTLDGYMADLIDSKRQVSDAVNAGEAGASGTGIMEALLGKMLEAA